MTAYRQGQRLQVEAQASGIVLAGLLVTGFLTCRNSQPGDMWCSVLTDVTQKQAQDFWFSMLKVGIHAVLA